MEVSIPRNMSGETLRVCLRQQAQRFKSNKAEVYILTNVNTEVRVHRVGAYISTKSHWMEVYIPTNVNTEVQVPLGGSIHSHKCEHWGSSPTGWKQTLPQMSTLRFKSHRVEVDIPTNVNTEALATQDRNKI